jgi:hypothetical protein
MSLDITTIAPQIGDMIVKIKSGSEELREHLKYASAKMDDETQDIEHLKRKIANAHTPWPVAKLYEGLAGHYAPPPASNEYTAFATDGSHIDVDRHKAARCYLINIGTVSLHYGQQPAAELTSEPHLYADEQDLTIKDNGNLRREQRVEGALLDARRSVEECRKLAEMAAALPAGETAIALMDGSLVMYGLEAFPDFVAENLLDQGFLKYLDQLRQLSESRRLTLASYISLPGSADVVNALRIAICPQESADCEHTCATGNPACDAVAGINDRTLFASRLRAGERSAIFINPSHVLERYGPHQIYFFYLKVDEEIARVEMPAWIALHKPLVDLTHALVLDQCRRGQGYPVVLSEAHEQAVVTGADREQFWNLVDRALEEEKLPAYTSTKSRSKRTRWL